MIFTGVAQTAHAMGVTEIGRRELIIWDSILNSLCPFSLPELLSEEPKVTAFAADDMALEEMEDVDAGKSVDFWANVDPLLSVCSCRRDLRSTKLLPFCFMLPKRGK